MVPTAAALLRLNGCSGTVVRVPRMLIKVRKIASIQRKMTLRNPIVKEESLHRSPRKAIETRARQAMSAENKTNPEILVATLVIMAALLRSATAAMTLTNTPMNFRIKPLHRSP